TGPTPRMPAAVASMAAVGSQRAWAPVADRRARIVLLSLNDGQSLTPVASAAEPVRVPWMAEAVVRITRDARLQSAMSRLPHGISDASFARSPWQVVAVAADGAPVVAAAAASDRLLVASGGPASDLVTPLLTRSIANALADVPDVTRAEVVPIADTILREWT